MNIRTEDTGGIRTYFVNNVPYKKLEDVPEEFRHYFADANNNGFPDQFDSLIDMARGKTGAADFLKSSLSGAMSPPAETGASKQTSTGGRYLRDDRTSRGFPFYIKALFFILIGLLAAWFVVSRLPAAATSDGIERSEEEVPIEEQSEEIVAEPEVAEAFPPQEYQFVMEDPNEPPYGVYASLLKQGTQILRFDLPDGEVVSSGTERIFVDLMVPQATTLQAGIIAVTVIQDECLPGDLEWSSKMVGGREFKTAYSSDRAAGHTSHTFIYALEGDQCLHFILTLNKIDAGISESPVTEYDTNDGVNILENMLRTLKFN